MLKLKEKDNSIKKQGLERQPGGSPLREDDDCMDAEQRRNSCRRITDNQIASFKVPEGYKLKAYVDVNFAGEQMVFTESTAVLNEAMALKISSIVVE